MSQKRSKMKNLSKILRNIEKPVDSRPITNYNNSISERGVCCTLVTNFEQTTPGRADRAGHRQMIARSHSFVR